MKPALALTTIALALMALALILNTPRAHAHWKPGKHNVRHAINLSWCGRANRYCGVGAEAWAVAWCETGGTMSVWANNGQYLGLWQMGSYARARYGHGWNAWAQARAAHRYWDAGKRGRGGSWGPWECKP